MPLVRLITWAGRKLKIPGFTVDASPFTSSRLVGRIRDLAPAAVLIDLDRSPAHGRAVAMVLRSSKSTCAIPIVFAGGLPEKVARARRDLPDAIFTDWPAALIAFMAIHLFMVVRQGVTAPPARGGRSAEGDLVTQRRREMDEYHVQKEAGEPFYPYSLSKDAAAALIVFVAIIVLAWRFPAEVGQFPDPTDTNYNPLPEWYFLFLFQFLKYFPGSLEPVVAVVLPSLAILGLLVLPFVDLRLLRNPLDCPLASAPAPPWPGLFS